MAATLSDVTPAAVATAEAELTSRITAAFSLSDQNRHTAIQDALYKYSGDILGDPAAVLRASVSMADLANNRELAQLKGLVNHQALAPQFENGVLVDPLEKASKMMLDFETPSIPDNINLVREWRPDTATALNLARCFFPCGPSFDGLAISAKGGAYGLSVDYSINGICLPAFADPTMALRWFEKQSIHSARIFARAMRNIYRKIVSNAMRHKFTLEVDGTNNYIQNNRAAAPNHLGHYRNGPGNFASPIDIQKLAPLSAGWLNILGEYYVRNYGSEGASGFAANGGPMWTILDSHPHNGFLHNEFATNPAYNTQNQEFQKTGNILSPFGHQGIGANALAPWEFRHSTLFDALVYDNITGELFPMASTVPVGDIDAQSRSDMGIIAGDVDIMNPAVRNPDAIIMTIAPQNLATVLTVSEPYAHASVGEMAFSQLHSPVGVMQPRPRIKGQLADIIDTYVSAKMLVVPNQGVSNMSTGILCRPRSPGATAVNMCGFAGIVGTAITQVNDECPRDASFLGFLSNAITGPAVNDTQLNIGQYRLIAGTTATYEASVLLRPGQTVDYFQPLANVGVGGAITVITVNKNGTATTRRTATLDRGFNYDKVAGGMVNSGQLRFTFAAALPADTFLRSIHPADALPTGVNVVKGTVEIVRNVAGAIVANQLYVQLTEIPTPAQWAVGANKTLTTYDISGAVIASYAVTLADATELPNVFDGNGVRILLQSASSLFTRTALSAADRVTIA